MKYTAEQLRYMALDFFQAAAVGDIRCEAVIAKLSAITGMSHEACVEGIRALAAQKA